LVTTSTPALSVTVNGSALLEVFGSPQALNSTSRPARLPGLEIIDQLSGFWSACKVVRSR
jgi:hypothetical protein